MINLYGDHRMTLGHVFFLVAALFLPGGIADLESSHRPGTLNVSEEKVMNQQALSKHGGQRAQSEKFDESRQSSAEDPATANDHFNRGKAALQAGDLPKAAEHFRKSLAIHEKLAPFSLESARDLNALGDISQQRGE